MKSDPFDEPPPYRPLRVAVVAPPWFEVPPAGYGGVEQVCSALVDSLVAAGHEVTLFGAGARSGTAARLVRATVELQHHRLGQALPELAHLARVNRMLSREAFDVVHDHTTLGPVVAARRAVPTVATVHNRPTGELRDMLADVDRSVGLVAISHAQRRLAPELPWAGVVHNGMSVSAAVAKSCRSDGPVLWLARFSEDKGPDLAIRACRSAGLPLVLAGKCDDRTERRYLEQVIEPMLGPDVSVIRNPDRDATVRLMLAARCLILPVRWEEPFGMVLVEAMAAGTPVVALNRGAVVELVRSGETGFICDDPAELPDALLASSEIDPARCVGYARRRFSAERMAGEYVGVYRRWAADPAVRRPLVGEDPDTDRARVVEPVGPAVRH